jgi:hypothetical protein
MPKPGLSLRPRIAPPKPEWGDAVDVRRQFGLKESFLYDRVKEGQIRTTLVKGRGASRGKRLYHFGSIRKLLAESEVQP